MRASIAGVIRCAAAVTLLLSAAGIPGSAQTTYTSAQNVQPAFEGWERNPDGTFSLLFGYLNRNYVEEVEIPVGSDNSFAPGPADRGQPTHFYPRRQSFVFKVQVPADWGEKTDLVWTVTHNGRTSKAVGRLWPVWEVDEFVWLANRTGEIHARPVGTTVGARRPPSIQVVGNDKVAITLPESVVLTVSASGAGEPARRPQRVASQTSREPQRPPEPAPGTLSVNGVPWTDLRVGPVTQDMVRWRVAQETGLAVSWLHYRGPGKISFDPQAVPIKPDDANARTTVRFSEPGTYVVRAVADNRMYTTPVDVTVVVARPGTSSPRTLR